MEDIGVRKEVVFLEDGRRAEKFTQEIGDINDELKIVTEVYAEPKIEKKLTQRVIDFKKPVITRREIEYVDEEGNVVEKKVESLEPDVQMQLREHIKTENSVSAQSVNQCDCYVTQEEMKQTFTEGFLTICKLLKEQGEVNPPVTAQSVTGISALSAFVGEKVESEEAAKAQNAEWVWVGLGSFLAAAFVYVVFFL